MYLCNQFLDIFFVDYYNHLGWICVRFVQFKLVSFSLVFRQSLYKGTSFSEPQFARGCNSEISQTRVCPLL